MTMILKKCTILITGGSSGIGLELARQLLAKNNTVIICGRSSDKLQRAKDALPGLYTFTCDIANETERQNLFRWMSQHHPSCNVLFNNAAIVHKTNFRSDDAIIEKAQLEINTNLLAPIALAKLFLSAFETKDAAIINITTGLVYTPRAVYPIYNATKAGLHSFTLVLRHQLKNLSLRIIEVMMPVVDTPWHKGDVPKIAISAEKAVTEMIVKIEKGKKEIKVGAVPLLYLISRIAPRFAFSKINQIG
jgi:uncharacterized oxidoreductase